jgi:hypothetical protein
MTMKTRSQTKTTAQRTLAVTQDIEDVFRKIHQGAFVLVNPSDLTEAHRILWWTTGVEEGAFEDEDIPDGDYPAVYKALHGN